MSCKCVSDYEIYQSLETRSLIDAATHLCSSLISSGASPTISQSFAVLLFDPATKCLPSRENLEMDPSSYAFTVRNRVPVERFHKRIYPPQSPLQIRSRSSDTSTSVNQFWCPVSGGRASALSDLDQTRTVRSRLPVTKNLGVTRRARIKLVWASSCRSARGMRKDEAFALYVAPCPESLGLPSSAMLSNEEPNNTALTFNEAGLYM